MPELTEIIRALSPEEVNLLLCKAVIKLPDNLRKATAEIGLDACYDRDVCRRLGIDYNKLNKEDIQRIMLYSCCMVTKYDKI